MSENFDAQRLATSLVGRTIPTPARDRPNKVLSVDGANVIVGTDASPEGEPILISQIQRGLDILAEEGEVRIEPETFDGYRRSSFIGAALASLSGTEVVGSPTRIRLSESSPLRDGLAEACALVAHPRTTDRVTSGDPLYQLVSRTLPDIVRGMVGDDETYKVKGSAGQPNFHWAETPWVSVFDRLVTDSAQRGHYIVFLIHPEGECVYLSLNQAVTEVRASGSVDYIETLEAHATRFRGYLSKDEIGDLVTGPIDLGASGEASRGYEAGNIAALHMSAGQIPHDAIIAAELDRFLSLYEQSTAGLDADESTASIDSPKEAREGGTESKRYRWHLRAEGRNSALSRKAKESRDYTCAVCGRKFAEEYGSIGKRCIDAHHLTPFSKLDNRPRELDPKKDFAVVCSNCHRMLHSETPPLTPEELSARLDEA